jgi:hypothetical protein
VLRTKAEEPSGFRFAVTHVSGLFCNASAKYAQRKTDEEGEKDILTQNQAALVGFRNAYVFESQTEGKELPELTEKVTGSVGEYRERLIDFVIAQGIELEFKESIAPLWA